VMSAAWIPFEISKSQTEVAFSSTGMRYQAFVNDEKRISFYNYSWGIFPRYFLLNYVLRKPRPRVAVLWLAAAAAVSVLLLIFRGEMPCRFRNSRAGMQRSIPVNARSIFALLLSKSMARNGWVVPCWCGRRNILLVDGGLPHPNQGGSRRSRCNRAQR